MRTPALLFALLFAACAPTSEVPKPPPVAPIRVDVWHDTVCPWCRIGLHNLDSAVAGFTAAPVEIVHHPFLLEPDAPASGTDMKAHLAQKFGSDRLEPMLARVSQAGAPYGVKFNWDAVKVFPNTAASHALIDWAPEAKRPMVAAAIQRAHFEEGKNIGDVEVLSAIAKQCGLDAAAARAAVTDPARLASIRTAANDAARRGISGVPHYEIAGRSLEGAQSPDAIRAALQAAVKR